jgi:hypothetical protein
MFVSALRHLPALRGFAYERVGSQLTEKALQLIGNRVRLGCGFAILLSAFAMI